MPIWGWRMTDTTVSPETIRLDRAAPGPIRELRLALVCYGGVSLAIYMHGQTKELNRLVRGSVAHERGEEPTAPTERVYRDLLRDMAGKDPNNVATRVVIDIIAGTSAGGINGIYLAKALAHDLSQDALRDLWFNRGDIGQLIDAPLWLPKVLKVPYLLSRITKRTPLRGNDMALWLYQALQGMESSNGADRSLVPDRHELQLFVTVTDFYGYARELSLEDPKIIRDKRHKHVLQFKYSAEDDDFSEKYNAALAFAARTTSCFPGAFPPVSIAGFEGYLKDEGVKLDDFRRTAFRVYDLADADVENTYFVDGGVLDNSPFGLVVRAIRERPAASEVDRRLIYLEPDPGGPRGGPEPGPEPKPIGTILGSVSGIPKKEPILDDLIELASLNEKVRRVQDIIVTSFDDISDRVTKVLGDLNELPRAPEASELASWATQMNEEAKADAGFSYATYIRTKIGSVVDRYSSTACSLCDYPVECNQAHFVRAVFRTWAAKRNLFEKVTVPSKAQIDFLKDFDLDYGRRRLAFVISALSWWYREAGKPGFPEREQLDAAKARLYEAVEHLNKAADGDDELGGDIQTCFGQEALKRIHEAPGFDPDAFVEKHMADLDRMSDGTRIYLSKALQGFSSDLYSDLLKLTTGWGAEIRRDLLVRYLGFPFWDVLLFPIQALTEAGERDFVEVMRMSPRDARLLEVPDEGGKLKGVGLHHFAAFFERSHRENDYLWGRLDSAERMISILLTRDHPDFESWCRRAFAAILDEEKESLPTARPLIAEVERQASPGVR